VQYLNPYESDKKQLVELQAVFRPVFRAMVQEWNKHVEQGISGSQAVILEKLELHGRQKAADLAEMLSITPGAVTGLCDKLIKGGYANRSRTERDRRIVYLEITAKGSEALQKIRILRTEITEMFYNGLSEEDLSHLIRIYKQVLDNIESQKG
jgi:DNA-binding MarR family transcriptional regulator